MKNIFVLLSLFLFSECGTTSTTKENTSTTTENSITLNDAQIKNAGIVVGRGEKKNISSVLKVNGKIEVPPQNIVSISVPLGGYLKTTHLLPGTKVKKGETIATIEDQQYIQIQQDYLTSVAKLSYSEKEYNRQKDLNQSKASSDKQFQLTEADYKSQKIATKSLYEKLKLIGVNPESLDENTISRSIHVYAPIDGYVSKVNVNIGKYVNPADVIFELVNPTDIHLGLTIFEKDVNKLFIGQKLKAYTNNEQDKKHNAEIILISQDLSAERSVMVHCHFEDYDKTLLPGMYMNAEIDINASNSFVVTEEAIVNFEDNNYIFIEEGKGNYKFTEVKTGISENGFTEIVDAAALLDKPIVTKGAYSLLMGLKNKAEE
ncbi:MAG: efflux RND transporter periplasmic adaptor subunit [Sphingobacteriaceae bacterium]|nr:efflux RND transporter periplasmic adaptor subunit [Sphingobacteriaceae bacterium]